MNDPTTTITESLVDMLRRRAAVGLAKYGTTLDRTDLTLEDWLQHQLEELLDGAGYAQAALRQLRAGPSRTATMWREEWQGSGPQRGWHMRVLDGGNYGSVIAYLGDQISSEAVQALVSHHNAALLTAARQPTGEAVQKDSEQLRPMESAPNTGVFRLFVESQNGQRRVFAAEASFDGSNNGSRHWMITTGWTGWTGINSGWNPIGWLPMLAEPAPSATAGVEALVANWRERADEMSTRDPVSRAHAMVRRECADELARRLSGAQQASAGGPVADLRGAIEGLLEAFEGEVPAANCSCHLSAPCGDCVEWRHQREAIAYARGQLAKGDAPFTATLPAAGERLAPDMSKSWPERDYLCVCSQCGATFIGWKLQAVCRGCAPPKSTPSAAADVDLLLECDAVLSEAYGYTTAAGELVPERIKRVRSEIARRLAVAGPASPPIGRPGAVWVKRSDPPSVPMSPVLGTCEDVKCSRCGALGGIKCGGPDCPNRSCTA